ncbi:MAG: NAD-dependent malic enzyme, partial [Actinomycetota bacterium]|nr:NAD-dependent malic enzyme [Actinomycetota bacterium]
ISAPRCFEIEKKLRDLLDIPVFHDDQHGTAIVVLAALTNSLRVVGKKIENIRLVMTGAGAAGTAIARLLIRSGLNDLIVFNHSGPIGKNSKNSKDSGWLIENTNKNNFEGTIEESLKGADVFIGVSAPNILSEQAVKGMSEKSIVFALANPTPEIDPSIARKYASVVATGRSDYPNQINNVLAFPGIFRGLLDAQAKNITDEVLVAAAKAIADRVSSEQLNASFIVPSVFDPAVTPAVAQAVRATLGK